MSDPARYYFKKILKRREPSGKAALEGSTYHAGIEFALKHKQKNGHLPPLPDTLEFVRAYWDAETKKQPPGIRPDPARIEYIKGFFMSQIYASSTWFLQRLRGRTLSSTPVQIR
jgi:hypothetical protein